MADPQLTAGLLQQTLDAKFGTGRTIVALKWIGPQYVTYSCLLSHGVRPEQVELMARALGLAAQSIACRVSTVEGGLLLEIPLPEAERRVLLADRLDGLTAPKPTAAPLGVTTGGRVLWLDLADERQAHVLIGGGTGTGKSVLTRWLLYRWLAQNPLTDLRLLAADPKVSNREGLLPFTRASHLLHPIQRSAHEVVRLLTWVLCEIERREHVGEVKPRILVVLEEVAHYTDQSQAVTQLLKEIMQVGRGWGVNVLATTQHPGAKSIGDGIVNFPVTVLGRVARGTQVYGAAGRKGTGADELLGRGDMLYLGAGETVRFQAPLGTAKQWLAVKKGGAGSLENALPRPDQIATGANPWRSGKQGRLITPADVERVRPLIQAGRGVDAVRRELGIGTDRARVLYQEIKEGAK